MSREIKFRYVYKHCKTGEIRVQLVTIDMMEENMFGDIQEWEDDGFCCSARDQYTGLKDKNVKEIYEGDILRDKEGVGEVKWLMEACAFVVRQVEPHKYFYIRSDGRLNETEVIGNIYEHPSLLGDTEAAAE